MLKVQVENFDLYEICCPCGKCKTAIDLEHIFRVQVLRYVFDEALTVNSWHRCVEYNNTILGSSKNSQHILGRATDFSTKGWSSEKKHKFIELALSLGFSGIGIYSTFIHLDSRKGSKSIWIGD